MWLNNHKTTIFHIFTIMIVYLKITQKSLHVSPSILFTNQGYWAGSYFIGMAMSYQWFQLLFLKIYLLQNKTKAQQAQSN